MFLKKIVFENWTSRGVNSGVTQFHTHLRMFLDSVELGIENKRKENCFENLVLNL